MDIVENITKLAKSIGNGAVKAAKKSGEAVEITKLNLAIKSEEDNIDAICMQIGKIVYKKYQNKEAIDEDLINDCKSIDNGYEKIDKLKQEILEIKQLKLCKSCNSEIDIDIEFCPKCGLKQKYLRKDKKNNQKICSACSAEILEGYDYCSKCGKKVRV